MESGESQKTIYLKIKSFECTYCSKLFKKKWVLDRNQLIHAGPGFACNMCNKLQDHKKVHHKK